ncbi:MAG TPA: class I SAM-dependent methyltransferase [Puia sp.]|nr:class I SAM-dependent methyltransferase [Puia sp.]
MSKGTVIGVNAGAMQDAAGRSGMQASSGSGAAFDILAHDYDTSFSHSLTGYQQRLIGRYRLNTFLAGAGKGPLRILEINCGTGEDALWLASLGHEVVATDQSAGMIRVAQKKIAGVMQGTVSFLQCGFGQLADTFRGQRFDLIFSNFAGLNCVPPGDMPELGMQFHDLLNEEGHLAIVVFGKYCWWETCYYLVKGDVHRAFRRWSNKKSLARLGEGVDQPVYYYSVGRFVRMWRSFRLMKKGAIGLFVPPSYLERAMQRNPRSFRWLVRLEKGIRDLSAGSAAADHTYMLFKKELK